jgi:hypothetical protein
MKVPMSTKATSRQESSEPFDRLLPQHVYLGRDRHGYDHHLDRATATVHRIATDGVRERRTDLTSRDEAAPRALEVYLRWIASSIGWDDRRKYVGADLFGRPA